MATLNLTDPTRADFRDEMEVTFSIPDDLIACNYVDVFVKWSTEDEPKLFAVYDCAFRQFDMAHNVGIPTYALAEIMAKCERVSKRYDHLSEVIQNPNWYK